MTIGKLGSIGLTSLGRYIIGVAVLVGVSVAGWASLDADAPVVAACDEATAVEFGVAAATG